MQLIPQFYDSDDDDTDDLSAYSLGQFKFVEKKEALAMCDIKQPPPEGQYILLYSTRFLWATNLNLIMAWYVILECIQSSVSDESDTDDEYMIPPDAALGYVEPSSFGRSSSSEEAARNRKYTTTMPTSSHDNVSHDSNN